MGQSIDEFWLALGDHDAIVIVNMPDNVTTPGAVHGRGSIRRAKSVLNSV